LRMFSRQGRFARRGSGTFLDRASTFDGQRFSPRYPV
jgi:hypothetical protein